MTNQEPWKLIGLTHQWIESAHFVHDTREMNKNEFMISFNENQIEFSSTLDLERKYKTLLNKRSGNNSNISPIANRLRSGTSSKN